MKYLKFICILLLVTLLSGCVFNDPKYINLRTKPNLYYYSSEIYDTKGTDCVCSICTGSRSIAAPEKMSV